MTGIELVIAPREEWHALIENAIMNAREAKERLIVVGDPQIVYSASRSYRTGQDGRLPMSLAFIGLEAHVLRSTQPDHFQIRDMLAVKSKRKDKLVALVPPLRTPAEACPLLATARLATGGATLIAEPAVAAMIAHLINPERRIAA